MTAPTPGPFKVWMSLGGSYSISNLNNEFLAEFGHGEIARANAAMVLNALQAPPAPYPAGTYAARSEFVRTEK